MHNYNDSLKLVMHSSRAAKCIYMPYYTSHKVSSTEQKPQNLDLIFVMQIFTSEAQKQFTRLRKTAQKCYEQYIKSVFVSFWAPYVLLRSNFDSKC